MNLFNSDSKEVHVRWLKNKWLKAYEVEQDLENMHSSILQNMSIS